MKKAALLLLFFSILSYAVEDNKAQSPYTKGLNYTELDPAYETGKPDKVIIYEFFGYKCPHCAHFQPFMKPWHEKMPDNVELVRVPVVFQPGWDVLAKAYYTAETMGIVEKSHEAMFDAIHKERKRFNSLADVAKWYAENYGVDEQEFLSTANSFMIDSKIRQSNNMMRKMQVTSTPTLIVNGKYKPNPKTLGSYKALVELAQYLTDMEVQNLQKSK